MSWVGSGHHATLLTRRVSRTVSGAPGCPFVFAQIPPRPGYLLLNVHAPPERDVILDLRSGRFRFRIEPCRTRVPFAIYFKIVIAGCALPDANRMVVTRLKIFGTDRVRRKIVIALDFNCLIALCQNYAFPDCFCHDGSLDSLLRPGFQKQRVQKT